MTLVPLDNVFWKRQAGPSPQSASLLGQVKTEVAVVGAGILGLSTALCLAKAGIPTTVLEANVPGWGASGRNTGFVVPNFVSSLGPARVRALLGAAAGQRLCNMIGNSGDLVFKLIRDCGIDCDAEQSGWLQPAHGPASVELLRQRQAEWAEEGKQLQLLDRSQTARLTGIGSYHAALLDRTGGQINPLAYVNGLARAVIANGAAVCSNSSAVQLTREGSQWVVHCASGRVFADRVLLAVNALDCAIAPRAAKSLIPLMVYQIATSQLDEGNRASILPKSQCLSDTRRDIFAIRWTRDGRLLTGGLGPANSRSAARVNRSLLRRLRSMAAISGKCEIEFAWNGVIALSRDLLPQLFEIERGVYAAVGCCGRGLALSTALGSELAAFLRTDSASAVSVPVRRPAPIVGHAVARRLPALLLPLARWRDRLDTRTHTGFS